MSTVLLFILFPGNSYLLKDQIHGNIRNEVKVPTSEVGWKGEGGRSVCVWERRGWEHKLRKH